MNFGADDTRLVIYTGGEGVFMLRSSIFVAPILFLISGCSLPHPVGRSHVESTQNEATRSDTVATTEGTGDGSATSDKAGDTHNASIGETVFAAVTYPVILPVCFVWWNAHGCPD